MLGTPAALLPGALTVYLAFEAGGFFVSPTAIAAMVLLVVLVVRVLLATHPAEGFGAVVGVAAGTLALFALWTLLSGRWSHAPGRALVEFDRAALYFAAFVTFASFGGQAWRLLWMLRGLAVAVVVVCGIGLASRLLPEVWPVAMGSLTSRLSYPITYWNSFGLLAALGMIICLGLTSNISEPRIVRIMAASAMPILASALLLTLSRGAIAVGILGVVVLVVVGRPRGLLTALAATVPTTVIAVTRTYQASLLLSDNPLSHAARDQGEYIAVVVGLCAAGAALVRLLLLVSDGALQAASFPSVPRRWQLGASAAVIAAIAAVIIVAVDVPRQYGRFVGADTSVVSVATRDPRARLADVSGTGRVEQWGVALKAFRAAPLAGRGAGTFALSWEHDRSTNGEVRNAHSLYLEVMGELGAVGLVLICVPLLVILSTLARRARGAERTVFATTLAASVAWAAAAAIDWHWQLPAVTLWVFCLGGTAVARHERSPVSRHVLAMGPRLLIGGLLWALVAVVPLQLLASQDRLESAIVALSRERCDQAIDIAQKSLSAVGSRAQPYELVGRCASELGEKQRAISAMRQAVQRDPENWRPRYGLAVAQARSGRDPRDAARSALRLNPRNELVLEMNRLFGTARNQSDWVTEAQDLDIIVPSS